MSLDSVTDMCAWCSAATREVSSPAKESDIGPISRCACAPRQVTAHGLVRFAMTTQEQPNTCCGPITLARSSAASMPFCSGNTIVCAPTNGAMAVAAALTCHALTATIIKSAVGSMRASAISATT
ncbi:Uncharacterised protein [Mycobacteroides abscessus subsp. abscessus]|nr:Uncharacterised protein [Mycobacteroides abscessus subsp. abscessus]